MDYKALAKETVQKLLEYADENKHAWTEAKFSDGIKIWKRKAADGHVIYKGDVLLETTPQQLDDFLNPTKPYRVQWDKFLDKVFTVEDLGDGLTIRYRITKPALKGLISPRDTVDLVQKGETDEVIYYAATNIEHPSCPVTPAYVRAINLPSGFVVFKRPVCLQSSAVRHVAACTLCQCPVLMFARLLRYMASDVVQAAGLILYRQPANSSNILFLLLRTSYGSHHWTPPKGHIDPGEDLRTAAIRETQEEAGLDPLDYSIEPDFEVMLKYNVKGRPKEVTYWLGRCSDDAEIKLSNEHVDHGWFSLSEACEKYPTMSKELSDAENYVRSKYNIF